MRRNLFFASLVAIASLACGPSGQLNPDAGNNPDPADAMDDPPDCVQEGATQCLGTTQHQTCQNGEWVTTSTCNAPQVCANGLGCVDCIPNDTFCVDNSVHMCGSDGTDGGEIEACTGNLQCSDGECKDLCEEAATNRSYIGCEYWAVDLVISVDVVVV